MSEVFDNQLLETKKKKFIEVVNRICENRNLPTSYINFDGCPAENEDQLAHYHSDVNMICISKRQLFVLNFDDLEEVAAHEVAHILEQNHDSNFIKEENINIMTVWRPEGVVVIDGNRIVERLSKEAMERAEEFLKKLQEQIEREKEEEERKNYPLIPKPETEQEEHILTSDEIIKLTGSHEPAKEDFENETFVSVDKEKYNSFYEKAETSNEGKDLGREDREKRQKMKEIISGGRKTKKFKCLFGFHKWKKVGGPHKAGAGKFAQIYVCENCGKTKKIIG